MSLLLDALKKAADAKADKLKKTDGVDESPSADTVARDEIEKTDTNNLSQNVYSLPNAELNTIDSTPTVHRATRQNQFDGKDVDPKVATSSVDAQAFFASKVQSKALPRRPNLFLIIALMLFVLFLSSTVYFYYIKKESDLQWQLHQAKNRMPIIPIERATISTQTPAINENQPPKVAPKITQNPVKKNNLGEKTDQPVSPNKSIPPAAAQKIKTTKSAVVKVKKPRLPPKEDRRIDVVINESLRPADQLALEAYKAYKSRDFETAKIRYKQAISADPGHYDALLGLATTGTLLRDRTLATATYQEILRRYPNDPAALASLNQFLALEQTADIESELTILLSKQPDSAPLNFTLGNFYSQKKRWADAQAAYFKAYSKYPNNPDYAYNLAVSLDHLGKQAVASNYYKISLESAQQYPAKFSPDTVRKRLSEIR